MAKVSVTYKAPQGDSKVCELFGFTFFDGKPVEIEDNEQNAHALKKLGNNSLFETSGGTTTAAAGQPKGAVETKSEDKEEDDDDIKDKDIKKKGRW
jgi:hypothetical protein